jgi:hypothetical protein
MTDDRGQEGKTEIGGQKTDDGGERKEKIGERTEDRDRRFRGQGAEETG